MAGPPPPPHQHSRQQPMQQHSNGLRQQPEELVSLYYRDIQIIKSIAVVTQFLNFLPNSTMINSSLPWRWSYGHELVAIHCLEQIRFEGINSRLDLLDL